MSNLSTSSDLDYRPASYFWPMNLETHLLSRVKGAERQHYIRELISQGRMDELEDWIASEGLTDDARQLVGRVHPCFMGGEYLPDLMPREVEIARITLASVLQDVVSVRARQGKGRIYYRVVDEYNGETLDETHQRTSVRPLSLADLANFIDCAYNIREILNMNEMYCDAAEMSCFMSFTSPYYPQLGKLFEERFEAWAKECRREQGADEDVQAA